MSNGDWSAPLFCTWKLREMPIKRILRVSVFGCSCCCCFIERSNCFDSVKEAEWSMDAVRKQIYVCSHWGSGQHLWDPSTYFKLEPAWILATSTRITWKCAGITLFTPHWKMKTLPVGEVLFCVMERFGYPAFQIKASVRLEGGNTTILMWIPILLTCNNALLIFLSRNNSPNHNLGDWEQHWHNCVPNSALILS